MSNGIPLLILICCSPPAEATSFHICYRHLRFYRGIFIMNIITAVYNFLWGDTDSAAGFRAAVRSASHFWCFFWFRQESILQSAPGLS